MPKEEIKTIPEFEPGEAQKIRASLSEYNESILKLFLDDCSLSVKDGGKIKNIERHILKFYLLADKKDLDKWTKEDVTSMGIVIKNYDKSFHTANEMITYLKIFCRKMYRQNIDILETLDKIHRVNKRLDDAKINENNLITPQELEKMLRKTESFREKALLLLMWESGARPHEILNLKWKDIKYGDEDITNIQLYCNKTNKSRSFPVKEATIHLKRWYQEFCFQNVKPNDYIFPNPNDRNKPITSAGLNMFLRRLAEKSGINRRLWGYLFRHSRATELYQELPTPLVEQLLGHTKMFDVYAHISNKKAKEEMIKKIYHIEEVSPESRETFEKQIKALKNQIKEQKENTADKIKEQLAPVIAQFEARQRELSSPEFWANMLNAFQKGDKEYATKLMKKFNSPTI